MSVLNPSQDKRLKIMRLSLGTKKAILPKLDKMGLSNQEEQSSLSSTMMLSAIETTLWGYLKVLKQMESWECLDRRSFLKDLEKIETYLSSNSLNLSMIYSLLETVEIRREAYHLAGHVLQKVMIYLERIIADQWTTSKRATCQSKRRKH